MVKDSKNLGKCTPVSTGIAQQRGEREQSVTTFPPAASMNGLPLVIGSLRSLSGAAGVMRSSGATPDETELGLVDVERLITSDNTLRDHSYVTPRLSQERTVEVCPCDSCSKLCDSTKTLWDHAHIHHTTGAAVRQPEQRFSLEPVAKKQRKEAMKQGHTSASTVCAKTKPLPVSLFANLAIASSPTYSLPVFDSLAEERVCGCDDSSEPKQMVTSKLTNCQASTDSQDINPSKTESDGCSSGVDGLLTGEGGSGNESKKDKNENKWASGEKTGDIKVICEDKQAKKLKGRYYQYDNEQSSGNHEKFQMWEHEQSHTNLQDFFTCKRCGQQFCSERYLSVHMRAHEPQQQYRCDECGIFVTTNYYLKLHRQMHEPQELWKFACKVCHMRFPWRNSLVKHKYICQQGLPTKLRREVQYRCPLCLALFTTRKAGLKHKCVDNVKYVKVEKSDPGLDKNCASASDAVGLSNGVGRTDPAGDRCAIVTSKETSRTEECYPDLTVGEFAVREAAGVTETVGRIDPAADMCEIVACKDSSRTEECNPDLTVGEGAVSEAARVTDTVRRMSPAVDWCDIVNIKGSSWTGEFMLELALDEGAVSDAVGVSVAVEKMDPPADRFENIRRKKSSRTEGKESDLAVGESSASEGVDTTATTEKVNSTADKLMPESIYNKKKSTTVVGEHSTADDSAALKFSSPNSVIAIPKERLLRCHLCPNISFVSVALFVQHNKTVHKATRDGLFPAYCSVCGRILQSRDQFKRHMTNHTGIHRYQCLTCGHWFISRGGLRRHTQRKHGRPPNPETSSAAISTDVELFSQPAPGKSIQTTTDQITTGHGIVDYMNSVLGDRCHATSCHVTTYHE